MNKITLELVMGKAVAERLSQQLKNNPAWQHMLARADFVAEQIIIEHGADAWLMARAGLPGNTSLAALSWLGEELDLPEKTILRADPVCLVPNRQHLTMMPPAALNVSLGEASQLISSLNQHFLDDPLEFEFSSPERWYVLCDQIPQISTTALGQAAGRDLQTLLPTGSARGIWHNWWNEVQMLLHAHPVNQKRELRGLPLINAVWFWGEGTQPVALRQVWQQVISDTDIGRGLGRLMGARVGQYYPDILNEKDGITGQALLQIVDDIEVDITLLGSSLSSWLRQTDRHNLQLFIEGAGQYSLGRSSLKKFWRRRVAGF